MSSAMHRTSTLHEQARTKGATCVVDGVTACAYVSYAMSESIIVSSVSPSSYMGQSAVQWQSAGSVNASGSITNVAVLKEADIPAALKDAATSGVMGSTLTSSQSLLFMQPGMEELVQSSHPCVIHAAAGPCIGAEKSVFGDQSNVMAVRDTGFALLAANSPQECHDLAVVSHLAAAHFCNPFLHFFDGLRTSHELGQVSIASHSELSKLASRYPIAEESCADGDLAEQVDGLMESLVPVFGRRYGLFEYFGDFDAEMVIVIMGSGATVVENVVECLNKMGHSVGVVKIHLFRPWSPKHFIESLPCSVKRFAVLERALDETSMGGCIWQDVVASLYSQEGMTRNLTTSIVVGSTYGLGLDELKPQMVRACFEHLAVATSSSPTGVDLLHFDEISPPFFDVSPASTVQTMSWGYSGDGAAESAKRSLELCCGKDLATLQGYTVYSSNNCGLCTCTHMRINTTPDTTNPMPAPATLIQNAGVVLCFSDSLLKDYKVVEQIADGGILLVNTPKSLKELDAEVSDFNKRLIATRNVQMYTLDCASLAHKVGMLSRVDLLMQVAFFSLLPGAVFQKALAEVSEEAADLIKSAKISNTHNMAQMVHAGLERQNTPSAWASLPPPAPSGPSTLNTMDEEHSLSHLLVPVSVSTPYSRLLEELFAEELHVVNEAGHLFLDNAEYGYGAALAAKQARAALVDTVSAELGSVKDPQLSQLLQDWLNGMQCPTMSLVAARALKEYAESHSSALPAFLTPLPTSLLLKRSHWVVGGDGWGYEVGYRGLHPLLSSTEDVNVLLLETMPVTDSATAAASKREMGLYGMHYSSTAFVASVAFGAGQDGQLREALIQAKRYNGPSLVVAYLPSGDDVDASEAVANGLWPLYRYDPSLETDGKLWIDDAQSQKLFAEYLQPDSHVSLVVDQTTLGALPTLKSVASTVGSLSLEDKMENHLEQSAIESGHSKAELARSFSTLFESLTGTAPIIPDEDDDGTAKVPLMILFGSDGGRAESVANSFAGEAKARKLPVSCMPANDFDVMSLPTVKQLLFVVSTAGQGEFPGNAHEFWTSLEKNYTREWMPETKYAVFGMGDRHYWPKAGDEHYFCKPGKDIDVMFSKCGAKQVCPVGIGDDQDADGYNTGLEKFRTDFWAKLDALNGGAAVAVVPKAKAKARTVEQIKADSRFLRGGLVAALVDTSTGAVEHDDEAPLKHHGIYMQDDRDRRAEMAALKREKLYSFMIRVGPPGGLVTPQQYLALDHIADNYANGTLRITTRQAIQFHGVYKNVLKRTVQEINKACLTSLAACGDVNRIVMCNPNPHQSPVHAKCQELAVALTNALLPQTTAYHEIWLDKKPVVGFKDTEPLYGPVYLPRKFKIAIAVPPSNDVDVFAHCLGYIAVCEGDEILGFNITVGGGLGMTHNNRATYPRLADHFGFVTTLDQCVAVAKAVLVTQRDYGNRQDRKNSRVKYTVEQGGWGGLKKGSATEPGATGGFDWFKAEVESHLDFEIEPSRPYAFVDNVDRLGWKRGVGDTWHYGLFIENGRIADREGYQLKEGLRAIAQVHKGDFRMSPNQSIVIANVPTSEKGKIEEIMARFRMSNAGLSGMRQSSMACVALPTCSQAFSEAERYLPSLITELENVLDANGLRNDEIVIRMTGCPNGCGRPYLAEIGLVGKAPGFYNLYLGAKHNGERMSKLYKEAIGHEEILDTLTPMLERYSAERHRGEHFGDFVVRVGIIAAQTSNPVVDPLGKGNRPPAITFHEFTSTW